MLADLMLWFQVTDATRVQIALDLVNQPGNEVKDEVLSKAFRYFINLMQKDANLSKHEIWWILNSCFGGSKNCLAAFSFIFGFRPIYYICAVGVLFWI